jgi:gas vesicle protein
MELKEQSVEPHYLFTLEKILEHLTLLEEHLKDYPCFEDCITKHGIALRGYLSEMLTFAPESERKFWEEIKRKVEDYLREIVNKKLTVEGAIKLREIRKEIQNKILWKEKSQSTQEQVKEEMEMGEVVIDRWTWEEDKPKTPSEREELYQKYGAKCFLDPETRGFPICVKVGRPDEGKISCDGLRSAFVRARALITASKKVGREDLARKYDEISKKALELARKLGCRWVRDQYPEKLSENLNIQNVENKLREEEKMEKIEIPKWKRGKKYTPIPFKGELPSLLKKASEACLDVLADEDMLRWIFHHTEDPEDYRRIKSALIDIANIEYYLVDWKEE